ncbi:hypothetical protein SAMN05216275_106238 [Streptosporangium canum]|uniref:Uncharacterized protein n=1 Tax=Streptosporangium canum TaxID=324952 RepID=A0A1I3NJ23_9ACTN|nr:hypothetical protein [Streptosporangium canum]SFJ09167.1 hypothetical protein SAMN05216275_106238 [Streptosporangium canum]
MTRTASAVPFLYGGRAAGRTSTVPARPAVLRMTPCTLPPPDRPVADVFRTVAAGPPKPVV